MCLAGAGKKNLISLAFLIKVTSFRYEIFVYLKYLSGGNRELWSQSNHHPFDCARVTDYISWSENLLSFCVIVGQNSCAQIVRSISKWTETSDLKDEHLLMLALMGIRNVIDVQAMRASCRPCATCANRAGDRTPRNQQNVNRVADLVIK